MMHQRHVVKFADALDEHFCKAGEENNDTVKLTLHFHTREL